MTNTKRYLLVLIFVTAALLLAGIINIVSDEMNWNLADFIASGLLLSLLGFSIVSLFNTTWSKNKKVVLATVSAIAVLYIWAEFAVGIFTSLGN